MLRKIRIPDRKRPEDVWNLKGTFGAAPTFWAVISPCIVVLLFVFCLTGCATTPPPRNPNNLCEIFRENKIWYEDANESSRRWGIPIPVLMAFVHQESRYNAKAKPPRTTCLFIFPGPRPSTAYGYSQALESTWKKYMEATDNWGADRDIFEDAIDFVGWYCHQSHVRCGIAKNDVYNLYLAYHEGQGGFNRKSYRRKTWLKNVAKAVQKKAGHYSRQLAACENEFKDTGGCLWFF